MSLIYNKIERGNPSDANAAKLWYPVLKSMGMVKEKEVAKLLADETTLNAKEAEMAVAQLLKVVTNLLLSGNTVQLGGLGSFRLTAKSEGVDTKEKVSAAQIKKLSVRFTESAELKDAVKKATFRDAATLTGK
ncbi:MAG: HU family DNA-binding protein [Prevotellaceae bacterium]|jgi:predicted histone-like DNA-binding protein|nr:HU family DNA-binding protein [Prevotellaceae bacterium]